MRPRYRYKARHRRTRRAVYVEISVIKGCLCVRTKTYSLPHDTSTKDIHRYKQTMCEIERQKDLDKE